MGIRGSRCKPTTSAANDGQQDRFSRLLVLQATQRVVYDAIDRGRRDRRGTAYYEANCNRLENCIRNNIDSLTCPVTFSLNMRRLKDVVALDDFFYSTALRHVESCTQVQITAIYRALIRNDENIWKQCHRMIRDMPKTQRRALCDQGKCAAGAFDVCHVCPATIWETQKNVLVQQFNCDTPVAWCFYLYNVYEVAAAEDERRFWVVIVPLFNDSKLHAQLARDMFLSDVSHTQFEHALPSVLIDLILMYDVVHSRQAALKRLLDYSQYGKCMHSDVMVTKRALAPHPTESSD